MPNINKCIDETGKCLRECNEDIVTKLCDLIEQRDELVLMIEKQYEEKKKIETDLEKLTYKLCLINKSLYQRLKTKSQYDKTIEEIEKHYQKLKENSTTLRDMLKQHHSNLEEMMNKKIGTDQDDDGEVKVLYAKKWVESVESGSNKCTCDNRPIKEIKSEPTKDGCGGGGGSGSGPGNPKREESDRPSDASLSKKAQPDPSATKREEENATIPNGSVTGAINKPKVSEASDDSSRRDSVQARKREEAIEQAIKGASKYHYSSASEDENDETPKQDDPELASYLIDRQQKKKKEREDKWLVMPRAAKERPIKLGSETTEEELVEEVSVQGSTSTSERDNQSQSNKQANRESEMTTTSFPTERRRSQKSEISNLSSGSRKNPNRGRATSFQISPSSDDEAMVAARQIRKPSFSAVKPTTLGAEKIDDDENVTCIENVCFVKRIDVVPRNVLPFAMDVQEDAASGDLSIRQEVEIDSKPGTVQQPPPPQTDKLLAFIDGSARGGSPQRDLNRPNDPNRTSMALKEFHKQYEAKKSQERRNSHDTHPKLP